MTNLQYKDRKDKAMQICCNLRDFSERKRECVQKTKFFEFE